MVIETVVSPCFCWLAFYFLIVVLMAKSPLKIPANSLFIAACLEGKGSLNGLGSFPALAFHRPTHSPANRAAVEPLSKLLLGEQSRRPKPWGLLEHCSRMPATRSRLSFPGPLSSGNSETLPLWGSPWRAQLSGLLFGILCPTPL